MVEGVFKIVLPPDQRQRRISYRDHGRALVLLEDCDGGNG